MKKIYERTDVKGSYGEKIIKSRFERNFIPALFNTYPIRHNYDCIVSEYRMKDGIKISYDRKIDIKTFPPMLLYPNKTGISEKNFREYCQLNDNFTLLFVDEFNAKIYGDTLENLKLNNDRTAINNKYAGTGKRIVWDIDKMKTLSELFNLPEHESYLTEEEINNFKELEYWKQVNWGTIIGLNEYIDFIWKLFSPDLDYINQFFRIKVSRVGVK